MAYSQRTDLEAIYGARNVERWADLDSSGNLEDIAARITYAISVADAEIDSVLSGSPIKTPLDKVPTLLKIISATLAGVFLYESRGAEGITTDSGVIVHPYYFKRKWAQDVLTEIRDGRRRVPGII
ncbi:MAG TPA: DUF1320 family protein [Sedimentisphaerales bacterium]|nr:DUF1320 family protein [Methanothrix sp.]HON93667.1 DUF1320 family protein [Sedimentisphaerales bacterium]